MILWGKDNIDLVDFEVLRPEFVLPNPLFLHIVTIRAKLQELDDGLVSTGVQFKEQKWIHIYKL